MEDFEKQISESLRRKDPSPWLESRILAAAAQTHTPRPSFFQRRLRWVTALAAAVLLITGIAWQRERELQERAAGQAAKERLQLALKITSIKLQQIEREVVDRTN